MTAMAQQRQPGEMADCWILYERREAWTITSVFFSGMGAERKKTFSRGGEEGLGKVSCCHRTLFPRWQVAEALNDLLLAGTSVH